MGNRAWGMGKKLPMPYALCPSDGATIPLHATCGMELSVAFNEIKLLYKLFFDSNCLNPDSELQPISDDAVEVDD